MHAPGMYPGGHKPTGDGVSTVTPPPASSLQGLCGHLYERLMHTNTSLPVGLLLSGLRPAAHRALLSGLRPIALGAVAPLLCSPAVAPLVGTIAPLARRDGCPPRSVWDRRPTAFLPSSYACIRFVRADEDADHDRVADGADHDGADAGADARLVDADRVVDRLVVGSDDVALRALRDCAAVMRGVIERRRDGDADGVREKSRRAGDAAEEQTVTRIATVRSYHDSGQRGHRVLWALLDQP
jgi:hypothetical protein